MTSKRSVIVGSTFSIEHIEPPLRFWIDALSAPLDVVLAPYNQVMQLLLDPASAFAINQGGVNVLLLRIEDSLRDRPTGFDIISQQEYLMQIVTELVQGIRTLNSRSTASLYVILSPSSPSMMDVDRLVLETTGERLVEQLSDVRGVYCLTHSEIMALYPVDSYDNPEGDRIAHVPFTREYYTSVATTLIRKIIRTQVPLHKVVVVDCDNTLWNGACGELSPDELKLSFNHLEFQRLLVQQQEAGVLLCICSKNVPADVHRVFSSRRDMPLRIEHIISERINWHPKSQNIKSLATELNLGLDSFIFIDDSHVECAEVMANCPEVLTLQIPQDPHLFTSFLKHTWALDLLAVSAESRERTVRYRENRLREAAIANSATFAEFLAGLELTVRISTAEPAHIERVSELVVRTNQFNLTTLRRSPGEISAMMRDQDMHAKVIYVSDRFGDYGLTGAVFLRVRKSIAEVDTFLLSCRVLGRGVEVAVVKQLALWATELDLNYIHFEFRRTARNAPAQNFLRDAFLEFEFLTPEGATYKVPVAYARALSLQPSSARPDEETSTNAAKSVKVGGYSRLGGADLTARLTSVADIILEIDRRYPLRRNPASVSSSKRGQSEAAHEPPKGSVEEALAELWCDILRTDIVMRDDGFFALGGNSLLVVQLISRIAARFSVRVSMGAILRSHCLADMALLIAAAAPHVLQHDGVELELGAI